MEKIRTLIVDDSAFMRKLIHDVLSSSSRIEIVGTARNGDDALKKIKQLQPQVVTMDVEMPVMDGLEALKNIMNDYPLPVVMLSSTTQKGAENTLLAFQYGAVDFVAKPSGAISLDLQKVGKELIEKVISASKANIKNLSGTSSPPMIKSNKQETFTKQGSFGTTVNSKHSNLNKWESTVGKLICIGTSTGGPRALQNVLTKLPSNINAPILVVQHMPPGFTKSLANRLDSLSDITVKEAEDGEILKKGTAYIAPGGFHLMIKRAGSGLAVQLDQSPPKNGHRPSVDVMFESASVLNEFAKVAVIMTGMGADGTQGLIELKNNGAVKAIAESEESSIIFGMPKAAIATKMIDEIQCVENIAETILKFV
ncbi:MAG: chemotaxis response regulator protein-glutamate methylesterase [Bacillota bacterium]|nr:chemotaxis response regulator protein-glutamate methylesterase [Bacillota bacterium]